MKIITRITLITSAALLASPQVMALPGLPKIQGVSKESESADTVSVEQIEKDLRLSVIMSSRAIASFQAALGQKEQADIAAKNATCLEKNECGLKDAVAVVQTSSNSLKEKINEQKTAGVKLSEGSGKLALNGMVGSFAALAAGLKAVNQGKALMSNPSAMMKAGSVLRLMPSALQALTGIGGTFGTGLTYLSYSGVNTKAAQSQLASSLGGL